MFVITIPAGLPIVGPLGYERLTCRTKIFVDNTSAFATRTLKETAFMVAAELNVDASGLLKRLTERKETVKHGFPAACRLPTEYDLNLGYVLGATAADVFPLLQTVMRERGFEASLSDINPATLATQMTWHEIGHLLVPFSDIGADHFQARLIEGWCDAIGSTVAMALHRDSGTILAWGNFRDAVAAHGRAIGFSRTLQYDIGDISRVIAEKSPATETDIGSLLRQATTTAWRMAPSADSFRAAWSELRDTAEQQGENCIRILNSGMAEIRLDLISSKKLSSDDVERQIRQQISEGRRVRPPRDDLPGGVVASDGFNAAYSADHLVVSGFVLR